MPSMHRKHSSIGWACRGCSLGADQVAHLAHLNARDTTLAYASRAPQADIARLKARMGWEMPWYTITDGFDADFGKGRRRDCGSPPAARSSAIARLS